MFVDSLDRERTLELREEILHLISEKELRDVAIIVLANKQDLPNAMSVEEVCEKLELTKNLRGREWVILPMQASSDEEEYCVYRDEFGRTLADFVLKYKERKKRGDREERKEEEERKKKGGEDARKEEEEEEEEDPLEKKFKDWLSRGEKDESDDVFLNKLDDGTLDRFTSFFVLFSLLVFHDFDLLFSLTLSFF